MGGRSISLIVNASLRRSLRHHMTSLLKSQEALVNLRPAFGYLACSMPYGGKMEWEKHHMSKVFSITIFTKRCRLCTYSPRCYLLP